MKIAFFDCFSGVSGDMILGALVDAGLDIGELETELGKLGISGYRIKAKKTARKGIAGTKLSVEVSDRTTERKLRDIVEILDGSELDDSVKELSKQTFTEMARVEATIHGKSIDDIHLHEVGSLDAIIDVVGAFAGLNKLGIEAAYCSKIHVGTGFLECRHGTLPVPAPATLAMLKGIPIYSTGIEAELATPTGVCIMKALCKGFGIMPEMKVEEVGYGAGSRELEIPNLLRVYVGEDPAGEDTAGEDTGGGYQQDEAILIETNIDDMKPELLAYACEALLEQGALDVFTTPISMKKNRPGTMVSVLTTRGKLNEVLSTIFAETTTLGVRIHSLERQKLSKEIISVKTRFGEIRVKIGKTGNQVKNIAPEYESCKSVAVRQGIPLKDVYDEAQAAARKALAERKSPDSA